MSRIDELKKQHPQFNINYFDIFRRLDVSKSGKYMPVISHMVNESLKKRVEHRSELDSVKSRCDEYGFDYKGLNEYEIIVSYLILDYIVARDWDIMTEFMEYMERGVIDNKDILTYKNMEDVRAAVSSATLKLYSKELQNQIHKEFEDDTWIAVRPLSFEASMKYGASTKWCTTYKKEKEYFAKYFSRGVLVYFINKITGYKFALYSEVYEGNNDISFWNAEDTRVDFLQLDIDSYLLPIIKNLATCKIKNSEMLTPDDLEKVLIDCKYFDVRNYSGELNLVEPALTALEPVMGITMRYANDANNTLTINHPPYPDGYEDEEVVVEDEVVTGNYILCGNPSQTIQLAASDYISLTRG
jgi:hypothetical protein